MLISLGAGEREAERGLKVKVRKRSNAKRILGKVRRRPLNKG